MGDPHSLDNHSAMQDTLNAEHAIRNLCHNERLEWTTVQPCHCGEHHGADPGNRSYNRPRIHEASVTYRDDELARGDLFGVRGEALLRTLLISQTGAKRPGPSRAREPGGVATSIPARRRACHSHHSDGLANRPTGSGS